MSGDGDLSFFFNGNRILLMLHFNKRPLLTKTLGSESPYNNPLQSEKKVEDLIKP